MRISSNQLHQLNLNAIMDQFAKVSHTQQQISTGKRIIDPADDPLGTVEAMRLNKIIEETADFDKNIDKAEGRLALTESLMGAAQDILQNIRVLAIQAANASQNHETRTFIAREMRENLDNLFQLANSRDGADNYLFGGFQNSQPPFSQTAGTFVYNGDDGQRRLQIGQQRTIEDGSPGSEVFMKIPDGNGTFATFASNTNAGQAVISEGVLLDPGSYDKQDYRINILTTVLGAPSGFDYEIVDVATGIALPPVPYQEDQDIDFQGIRVSFTGIPQNGDSFDINASRYESIFSTIDGMATALELSIVTDAQKIVQINDINHNLSGLDRALDNLSDIRTSMGAKLNVIESQRDVNFGTKILMEDLVSNIVNVDLAKAISEFSLHMTSLEAAQKTFVQMKDLTVFNFL